ncbi:ABC transporter permease [bacterium]|nr:ABC transporter permease [bacterium]
MLFNELRVAFRQMRRNLSFSLINVFGLSVGIAATILIALYAEHQLTWDQFHPKSDDTYLLLKERHLPAGTQVLDDTWVPMGPAITEDYPEVKSFVRVFESDEWLEQAGSRSSVHVHIVDPSFLDVFHYPLVLGNPDVALSTPNSIVISESFAATHFGDSNPLGQELTIDGDVYEVKGVLKDAPSNSVMRPEVLVPFEAAISPDDEEGNNDWGSSFLWTFLELEEGTDSDAFEAQLPAFVEKIFGTEGPNGVNSLYIRLLPLPDVHNYYAEDRQLAWTLLAVGFVILLIASINFMNLSTAASLKRSREVGVRKVLGAVQPQLIRQFLVEAVLTSLIALVFAIALVEIIRPVMNRGLDLHLGAGLLTSFVSVGLLVSFGTMIGLLAGLYPAFYMSAFRPLRTIKGQLGRSPSSARFRTVLVVLQFSLSITLISGMMIVYNQIQFMKTQNLNFNADQVLAIRYDMEIFGDREQAVSTLTTTRDRILNLAGVQSASLSSLVPSEGANSNVFVRPEGRDPKDPLRMKIVAADEAFFETYGIEMVEGRSFRPNPSEGDAVLILNETARNNIGWKSAAGKMVNSIGEREVIGVVKDYHYTSLDSEVRPIIHIYRGANSGFNRYLSVRLGGADIQATMHQIEAIWHEVDPAGSFDYFFVDEAFDHLYRGQEQVGVVAGIFALIGVVIASLGLLGLVSYAIITRTREIGVRKVLGATAPQILVLVSRDHLKPVLIANLIAWPLAWYFGVRWLENYPYQFDLSPFSLLLPSLAALAIAFGTISFHAIRASRSNPAEALRHE